MIFLDIIGKFLTLHKRLGQPFDTFSSSIGLPLSPSGASPVSNGKPIVHLVSLTNSRNFRKRFSFCLQLANPERKAGNEEECVAHRYRKPYPTSFHCSR